MDIKRHPILLAFACVLGISGLITLSLASGDSNGSIVQILLYTLVLAVTVVLPVALLFLELWGLVRGAADPGEVRRGRVWDVLSLALGIPLTALALKLLDVKMGAAWYEQLINVQLHAPIDPTAQPVICALGILGLIGYAALVALDPKSTPPLACVLAMAALYLGMAACAMWVVQVTTQPKVLIVALAPTVWFVAGLKTIRIRVQQWSALRAEGAIPGVPARPRHKLLARLDLLLQDAHTWPLLAAVVAVPLLGVFMCAVALGGQEPDSVITGWLNTADWRLSTQQAPPNLTVDEHYLCTVAAGGHRRVVRPLRRGVRHGHEVIVNRQLCVANAFEQVLEERVPRAHRVIRDAYDRYGLPVARLVRSPWVADAIYLAMKPLEWVFLAVVYLNDAAPENRIAIQYTGHARIPKGPLTS